jgi:hypothetical protein
LTTVQQILHGVKAAVFGIRLEKHVYELSLRTDLIASGVICPSHLAAGMAEAPAMPGSGFGT